MKFDLVLSGGRVIDPVAGRLYQADVAISGSRIAAIQPRVDQGLTEKVLDVQGKLVCPALIDFHLHTFEPTPDNGLLFSDRVGVRQGVSIINDCGSFGVDTAACFYETVVARSKTKVLGYTSVGRKAGLQYDLSMVAPRETVEWIERADWIRGVKGYSVDLQVIMWAKKIAKMAGVPLMVHTGNPNGPYFKGCPGPLIDYVCPMLDGGDIITHVWHGAFGGILDRKGEVLPCVREAVERGVLLDNTRGNDVFSFPVAHKAIDQGLPVHIIGTDLHSGSVRGRVWSMARTMATALHVGMSMMDVVRAVTYTPARVLGLSDEGWGRIEVGIPANITVIEEIKGKFELIDSFDVVEHASLALVPRYLVLQGEVLPVAEEGLYPELTK